MPLNRKQKDIIIIAGQSILNGRGTSVRPSIPVSIWNINSHRLESIQPGVNTYTSPIYSVNTNNWGPETQIGNLITLFGIQNNTYIFKFCSDASMSVYFPGVGNTWSPLASDDLMDKFIAEWNLFLQAIGGYQDIRNITLLWSQGESEGFSQLLTPMYTSATKAVLDRFIQEFATNVDFNIIRLKVNSNSAIPCIEQISNHQTNDFDPTQYGSLLNVDDVALGPDGVHYEQFHHDEIGQRLFLLWTLQK